MTIQPNIKSFLLAGGLLVIGLAGISWLRNDQAIHYAGNLQDTLPKKEGAEKSGDDKTVITGDIDQSLLQLKKAQSDLEKQFSEMDLQKLKQELQQSLQQINTQKMEAEIREALKNIDLQKIKVQTEEALQNIDWKKMQGELQQSLQELKENPDTKKMELEIQKAMEDAKLEMEKAQKIDMKKIQQELQKAQENLKFEQGHIREEMEKAQKELKRVMKEDFKKELDNARQELDRSRSTLLDYNKMLDEMQADGLLEKKADYQVEYKGGELFIGGKKQPQTVLDKYQHYFKKQHVIIQKQPTEAGGKTIDL